ncbi:RNA-binding protein [Trypanosoma cruzi]|nr:RNA-binding protein [Trypanosoma cruzi]
MPALNSLAIAEMEVVAPRFSYAAAILDTRLCAASFSARQCDDDYPHFTKGLCRRHPRLTFRRQRLAWARDCDTSSRASFGGSPSPPKRHRPPSSRSRHSMDGGPFPFRTPPMSKLPKGKRKRKPFLIMQAAARVAHSASSAFPAILAPAIGVWVGNASPPQGAAG